MVYSYFDAAKAEDAPPQFPTHVHQPQAIFAQTPLSAPGSTQQQMPPTTSTPVQQQYVPAQPPVHTLAPTPLRTLNASHSLNSFSSFNPLSAQTSQNILTAPGPASYLTDYAPHIPFQPAPGYVNTHMSGNTLAPIPNIPSPSDMLGFSGPLHNASNHSNPLGAGLPGQIPGLGPMFHGNPHRRDPTSDPANFGHHQNAPSVNLPQPPLPAQIPPPYSQMMHAQNLPAVNYPQDASMQHSGFNAQLNPLPGSTRGGPQGVSSAYYPTSQPQMQSQLQPQSQMRFPLDERSFGETSRIFDEHFLALPKSRTPASYSDSFSEYGAVLAQHQQQQQQQQQQQPLDTVNAPQPPPLPKVQVVHKGPSSYSPPMPLVRGNFTLDGQVNFKPTETKKNARPKINKLARDSSNSKGGSQKRRKVEAKEHSYDDTYKNFVDILGITEPRVDITERYEVVLKSPLERYLFDFFVNNIAVFVDTYLVHEFFQVVVAELALYDETRMILDSMLCLSSLISQRMDPSSVDALCPYDYYQRCVYSVGQKVGLDKSEDPEGKILARCLISTNLLCIYEMFFVAVDSVYVMGAGGIFATIISRTEKSSGILKRSPFHYACFWATVVCDLILSLKLECPNTFSIEKMWRSLDPTYDEYDTYDKFEGEPTTIKDSVGDYSSFVVTNEKTAWWLQKIILLFILVNEFYNQTDVITQEDYASNKRYTRWVQLREKMDEYEKRMPIYLQPLIYMPAAEAKNFPQIFFKDEKTAVIGINFRLAKLLLYAALKDRVHVKDGELLKKELVHYPQDFSESLAKEVAGIMQTYDSDMMIWPVNIHSLRQASRYIDSSSPCFESLKNLTARVISVCQTRSNILDLMESRRASAQSA